MFVDLKETVVPIVKELYINMEEQRSVSRVSVVIVPIDSSLINCLQVA